MGREMVELQQRFPITGEAVWWTRIVDTTSETWHGGADGVARIRQLLAQPWEACVFHGIGVDKLPAELQYALLERVTAGAGLVLVGVADDRLTTRRREPVPGDPEADLFDLQRGRVARLPATPVLPYRFGWETGYDWWQQRLGRTVLWAAGKLPAGRPLAWRQAPGSSDQLLLNALPPAGAKLTWRLRREDGRFYGSGVGQPRAQQRAAVLTLSRPAALPAGRYAWELFLRSEREMLDWAVVPFTVASPRTVTVSLQSPWSEVGGELTGTVQVGGSSSAAEQLVVQVIDRRGRILWQTAPAPPTAAGVPFRFQVPGWLPMLVQVRGALLTAAGEIADGSATFNVVKRRRGQFNFLVWDTPAGPTGAYAVEALARLGMTLQLTGDSLGTPPPVLAAFDIPTVPYTTRIMDTKDANGHLTPVSWNHEPAVAEWVEKLAQRYAGQRQHGVFVYSLGDETTTRGSDTSPEDLAAYRRWLQGEYGEIGRLNASWGETLPSFEAVQLLNPADSSEAAARQAGRYARWYDRQAWERHNFLRLCGRFGEAFGRLDPDAKTGFEGAGTFREGDDLEGIIRTNGFWSPYPSSADLVVRDVAPREFPRSNWMGYTKDARTLGAAWWRMIANGCDSVWYWRWDGIGRFNGVLAPDLSPPAQISDLLADTRICREGLGDLLLRYTMQYDGVGILYSVPSAAACQLADGPGYGPYEAAHEAWYRALFGVGANVRYVTDAGLRRGELRRGDLKLLLLPRAEALGSAEANAVREFVAAGGTVVADLRPGLFTDRCAPRPAGVLDDLFGVRSSAGPVSKPTSVSWKAAGQGTGLLVDPRLALAGGPALGQTAAGAPVWISNAVGKGRAVLLNFPASALATARPTGVLGALLAQSGLSAASRLTRPAGAVGEVQVVRWSDGPAQLWLVRSDARVPAGQQATLALGAARRVFDLRTGRDLGVVKSLTVPLRAGSAAVYAALPDLLPRAKASITPLSAARGSVPELRVSLSPSAGSGAVYLTVAKPDGSAADWLQQVVVVPAGQTVNVPLPLALNDPVGVWKVRLRELFTQAVSEVPFTVLGKP
ncbi:MAG: beta-galactosidase [Fimbriimonadaceae bacterium]|nr:beta-galactosidase [Fimbriimonadaceae bacterium]